MVLQRERCTFILACFLSAPLWKIYLQSKGQSRKTRNKNLPYLSQGAQAQPEMGVVLTRLERLQKFARKTLVAI
jgi:hypothetical protein